MKKYEVIETVPGPPPPTSKCINVLFEDTEGNSGPRLSYEPDPEKLKDGTHPITVKFLHDIMQAHVQKDEKQIDFVKWVLFEGDQELATGDCRVLENDPGPILECGKHSLLLICLRRDRQESS